MELFILGCITYGVMNLHRDAIKREIKRKHGG